MDKLQNEIDDLKKTEKIETMKAQKKKDSRW